MFIYAEISASRVYSIFVSAALDAIASPTNELLHRRVVSFDFNLNRYIDGGFLFAATRRTMALTTYKSPEQKKPVRNRKKKAVAATPNQKQ